MTIGVTQERQTDSRGIPVSSQALAFSGAVTAGSSIHVICTGSAAALTFTCSDSVNGSYGAAKDNIQNVNGTTAHFVFDNTGAGTPTVTVTPSLADPFVGIWIREIGGTSGYDTHAGQNQGTPGTGTNAVTSGTATPSVQPGLLSGFAINNFADATPAAGTGFTSTLTGWDFALGLGDLARSEHLRYTSTSAIAATFTSAAGNNHQTVAAFFKESGGASPTVTDVNTTEVIADGQTGVAVTGTNLGASNANRTFALVQGSTAVNQTETGTGTSTAATLTIAVDAVGADIKFGSATMRVTITSGGATATLGVTVNPPTGQLYIDVTTPDPTAGNRITASADIAAGDQLQARGVGGGAAPVSLTLYSDATFSSLAPFDVRVWATSDSTWGAWATQSLAGNRNTLSFRGMGK